MSLTIRFNPEPSDQLVNEVEDLLGARDCFTKEYADGTERVLEVPQLEPSTAKQVLQDHWGGVAVTQVAPETLYVSCDKIAELEA